MEEGTMKAFVLKLFSVIAASMFFFTLPLIAPVFANTPDAGNSRMQISTGAVTANGQSTFTITITLRDSSNNLITSADSVYLTTSDSNVNINPSSSSPPTLNNGQATFTLSSNNPATDTINIVDSTTGNTLSRSDWVITFAPTPTQTPTPTPFGTCNDATPSIPQLTSAVSGGAHSIVLTWSAVAPVSYYLVSYGTTSGNYIYGNPNVGAATSYTVGSLVTGKAYYFAIKAVNGCMPSSYSNELSAVPGASTPTPTTEASGGSTNPTDTPTPTEGPPITPVPKSGSAGHTVVYSVIGILLVVSVVAVIFVNKSGHKPKPPTEPLEPPVFDSDQSKSFDRSHGQPEEPNQSNEQPPMNDPSHFS